MKRAFDMQTRIHGNATVLTVDGVPVENVTRAELIAPADDLTRLVVTQTFLDGYASGEAEVQFVRRLIGELPQPSAEQPPHPEVQASLHDLARDMLTMSDQAEVIGGGTVTLDDGRKAHVLYAITGEPRATEAATEPADPANAGG